MNPAGAARLEREAQAPPRREERARPSVGALEVEEPPRFTLPETEPGGEPSELTALVHRAVELLDRGQVDEAHELLRPRLARDGGLGPVAARIALLLEGARILVRLGHHREAVGHARRALGLAEAHGDPRLAAEALGRMGLAHLREGDLASASVSYSEALLRFRRLGEESRVAAMENNLGLVATGRGEWMAARAHFQTAIDLARRHAVKDVLGYRLKNLGCLEAKSGRWDRAQELLDEAERLLGDEASSRFRAPLALARGHLALATGRRDEAHALLRQGLAQALANHQPREEVIAREMLGDLAMERDQVHEAWQAYRVALSLAESLRPALDLECEIRHRLARAQMRLVDLPGAAESLRRARAAAEKMGDPYELARVHLVEAELATARQRPNDARAHYGRAVELFTDLGERYERGRALVAWAALLGDDGAVRRLLTRAAACFEESGATAALKQVEERLFGEESLVPVPRGAAAESAGHRLSIAGRSRVMVAARAAVHRAARCALPVLVEGPPRTGRTFLAHALHARSSRADRPLVVAACAADAADTILLDLLGDGRPGREKDGWIAQAEGGTLLLEDVGHLSPAAQQALLRFVTTGAYLKPGEMEPRPADVRVVAVTDVMADGAHLREDLRTALGAIRIALTPLAERPVDLAPFGRSFVRRYGGPDAPALTAACESTLRTHRWPGDLRQLEQVIRGALIQTPVGARALDTHAIKAAILLSLGEFAPKADAAPAVRPSVAPGLDAADAGSARLRARIFEVERFELVSAIERARGNKSLAAKFLHVSRKTLYARLARHGIEA